MIPTELIKYVLHQKDRLDELIANAAFRFINDNKHHPNFGFDLKKAEEEALSLSNNDDLCYDRLTTPLSYSLWYQAKRINGYLFYLSNLLYRSRNESSIRIFDLGAGTGAVYCACAVIISGMKELGLSTPELIIINVDTSPLMLDYHRSYIYPEIERFYPNSKIPREYHVNSWDSINSKDHSNNWIIASYLFDHSENIESAQVHFYSLINKFKPNKLILNTAIRKKKFVIGIQQKIQNYNSIEFENHGVLDGQLEHVQKVRNYLRMNFGTNMSRTPSWKDPSNWVYSQLLENTVPTLSLNHIDYKIDLFNPPFILRKEVELNKLQKDASKYELERPTIITGPAGCGKSLVLSEKILNIIDHYLIRKQLQRINILVTTFNKELEHNLRKWIIELLNEKSIQYKIDGSKLLITDDTNKFGKINFLHFDVLPTRIGKLSGEIKFKPFHLNFLNQIIEHAKKMDVYKDYVGENVMDAEFLLDEYERVWYGLEVKNIEHYLNLTRTGRGHHRLGQRQRKVVAGILSHYEKELIRLGYSSFTMMRLRFLRLLNSGITIEKYSHIIVDEFQDCTQADYSIFYGLLENNNNLILAGDLAQSVHLGSSSDIPRQDNSESERMNNRKMYTLEGSYRLPYRISECVRPLSKYIIENSNPTGSEMSSYRGAPPGARPIFVSANTTDEMAQKIISITDIYSNYELLGDFNNIVHKISILEKDIELHQKLLSIKNNVSETATILKIKGLEKRCVVWSTRTSIENKEEIPHFVYTILTRTSALLIIAAFPDIKSEIKSIINKLDKKRLLFWDEESQTTYNYL